MKALKSLLITLVALLLTGCYTQLQYSQKMNKVTDRNKKEVQENYRSSQEQANNDTQTKSDDEYSDYAAGEEDYVPVYYKDYEYAQKYDECNCSPYNVYNFYGSSHDWYRYNYYKPYYSYRSYLTLSPFYHHNWHHHHHFGYSRFAFSFSWGSPHFYHRFYHDPFYDYYYGYGYSPFAYNYHRYYGSFGYGYYYGGSGNKEKVDRNVRYGPRSIGTNRVVNSDRSRSVSNRAERSATVTNSRSKVQTRSSSVGTTRSRGTANNNSGSVTRTRSRNGDGTNSNGSTTRSRSGDNIQSDNSRDRVYIDRTGESKPVVIDRERYNAIRSRTVTNQNFLRNLDTDHNALQRARTVNVNTEEQKEHPAFFNRMKGFFENNTNRIITNTRRSNSSTIRSRSSSSSSRSSVSRSKSNSRSSVSRSSSSSSNSRSRGGSSSSSRSRSGGDSGSDRSRGGN